MNSGIYLIFNRINSKQYIGSAVSIRNRFRSHKNELNRNSHGNSHLQHSWNKYGEENFIFIILEEVEPVKEKLLTAEQDWIDTLNPEYNICKIAGNTQGRKHSLEAKKKISIAHKGNRYQLGMKRSIEHKAAISTSQRGKILSIEHKNSIATGSHQIKKTHCPKEHEYSFLNTYIHNNKRYCRECSRIKSKKAYQK